MEKFVDLCAQDSVDQEERVRLVEGLLDRSELHLGKRDNSGWYPIHYAAQYGRDEIVSLLLRHCDPHLETRGTKSTALHIACANGRLDVVEVFLRFCQDGALPKKDREGNTPLHLACKVGSLQITSRLLGKYPIKAIYEGNKSKVTPLGFAVRGNSVPVAKFLLRRSLGNPARKFPDFRQCFPSFKHKQSLDHPVIIFVMGNRQTGKSTLIKSLQVEGYLNRAIGVIRSTSGVEHHSGGVVPSDVSSYGYGRAKFYELASGYQTTQENIFLSIAKPAHTIFLIVLSFKDERKEMESHLLYWLSFIHNQFRSERAIKLNVAVVGSFRHYNKLGSIRLDNPHRLYLVYHHVLSSESNNELCSHFHFLGKYSMDCRRSESPGLTQLRNVLGRKCNEVRPSGGEQNVPSSCYVLFSALHELLSATSGIPALKLSEIVYHVSQSVPNAQPCSLLSLLPTSEEELKPYLEILEQRRAIVVINHIDPRDPWIIFDEHKLLSRIDGTLIQKALVMSHSSNLTNPAIMPLERLLECLSPVPLEKEVLLNIIHHYKIAEVMSHGNVTKYFLPSILQTLQFSEVPLPLWNLDDPKYSFGFAWCIVPQPDQTVPFFMPRFLNFMLYELLASTEEDDLDRVTMSHTGLHYEMSSQLNMCVTVDKSAININMRCTAAMEVTCLKYRNRFVSVIHQQRQLLQPSVKVNEFIIPMEEITLPVQKLKYIQRYGTQVTYLKNAMRGMATTTTTGGLQKLLSFEPYTWLSKLSEAHQRCLLDPALTNVPAEKEFIQDLARCTERKWSAIEGFLELLQTESDTNTSADEADQGPNTDESSGEEKQGPQHPPYGQLLEFFSTMSIFQSTSELISALKDTEHIPLQDIEQYNSSTGTMETQDEGEHEKTLRNLQPPSILSTHGTKVLPESTSNLPKGVQESVSDLPASSTSSSAVSVAQEHTGLGYQHEPPTPLAQPDIITITTCSSNSDQSSVWSKHSNVPSLSADKSTISTTESPRNVSFISGTEVVQCGSSGARFEHNFHKISFYIPPQAVKEGSKLILEFGVALVGPFTFPEGITPVSPILWVNIQVENDQGKLQKQLEIGLPHAVSFSGNSNLLHFMCAENQADHYCFRKSHKSAIITSNKGKLCTKLSKKQYFFCIASKTCREIISKTQYFIISVAPENTCEFNWNVYFFVTYALPACVEMVKQQFGTGHLVRAYSFQFDTSVKGEPSILVEFPRMPDQWTLTKDVTHRKIEASLIRFGSMSSYQIDLMNMYHTYPPNFTIAVNGHRALCNTVVQFHFKGGAIYLETEVALMLPRKNTIISSTSEDPFTDQNTEDSLRLQVGQIHAREPSVTSESSLFSVQSEPVPTKPSKSKRVLRIPSESLTPRAFSPKEKESAMNVLVDNIEIILKHLDQKQIRPLLYKLRVLTDDDYERLCSLSISDANEVLFTTIKKKGVTGFQQFMIALEKTSDHPGHHDILETLKMGLIQNHARSRSMSAAQILHALPSSSTSHSLDQYPTAD